MREILFRGQDANGNWHEGFYLVKAEKHLIWSRSDIALYEVKPETVGQFIGLLDKNGVKIFEGDIYKDSWDTYSSVKHVILDKDVTTGHNTCERTIFSGLEASFLPDNIVIVGNIYDTPEFLKRHRNA